MDTNEPKNERSAEIATTALLAKPCPDCGVGVNDQHRDGCDVERCPDCGGQMISCNCGPIVENPRIAWEGKWPGVSECEEFGWYAKFVAGKGWVSCEKAEEEATADLNRLYREADWDALKGRFVLSR